MLKCFIYSSPNFLNCYLTLTQTACYHESQVVPHITDAIKNWIESVASIPVDGKDGAADVCVIELGGTVGMI